MTKEVTHEAVDQAERKARELRQALNKRVTKEKLEGNFQRNQRIHKAAEITGLTVGDIGRVISALGVEDAVRAVDLNDKLLEEFNRKLEQAIE